MQTQLLLSISSHDKPGVVESISAVIEQNQASWQESRLAHLCGKFVGVIQIYVDEAKINELTLGLNALSEQGVLVTVEPIAQTTQRESAQFAKFTAVGPDRTGIVKEISTAFSLKHINVEELETNISSMPYSGDPIFEAQGLISMPSTVDFRDLLEKMDAIANDLGLDLDVDQTSA